MKIYVSHIAKLANLTLKKEEEIKYQKQLLQILAYIENLTKVDTEDVKETSQTTGLENVTSKDVTLPSMSQEEALFNTQNKHNGLFKVKAILEQ